MTKKEENHPAARTSEQLAWAIWLETDNDRELFAVTGDCEKEAKENALSRSENESEAEVAHIDGPYQNAEPGVWRFEYVTEHREVVVAEGPTEEYASETAQNKRDYQGELVETTRTDSRKLDVELTEADNE